jgi:hypothetical protein
MLRLPINRISIDLEQIIKKALQFAELKQKQIKQNNMNRVICQICNWHSFHLQWLEVRSGFVNFFFGNDKS